MHRTLRLSLTLAVPLALLVMGPGATAAELEVDDYSLAAQAAVTTSASPGPCKD